MGLPRDKGDGVKIELNDLYFHELAIENGYVKAPAPATPPQTEEERLVKIAKGLPKEVWDGSGWEDPQDTPEHDIRLSCNPGWHFFTDAQFPAILLGIMAAYVGTEPNAHVVIGRNGVVIWSSCLDDAFHDAPDLLTAYAACCKAIAERRKGGK